RFPARHGAAQARQIVQLSERARERRLAALVRARHHENAFPAFQVEVVADDWRFFADELLRQAQVERLVAVDLRMRHAPDSRGRIGFPGRRRRWSDRHNRRFSPCNRRDPRTSPDTVALRIPAPWPRYGSFPGTPEN